MGEIVDLTLKRVKDKRLRNLIYGSEQPDEKSILGKFIFSMNNIMFTSFFGLFILWKHRLELETGGKETANVRRINNTFSDIFIGNGLNTEIIAFLLTEIQLDVAKNPLSLYKGYVKGDVINSKFQQIAEIIRVWRVSYKHAEQNLEKLTSLYTDLLKSLPILKNMRVDDSDGKIEITVVTEDEYEITEDMSCFIKLIEYDFESDYYFLHRAIKADNLIKLEYMDFSGANTCSGLGDEDFTISVGDFRKLIGYSASFSKADGNARNLSMLNFRYIRRLAMAVADVLQDGTKKVIKCTYENNRKYKEIFASVDAATLNWDNIMVLLMLEEGPSDVIEEVLKNDANAFDNILENISVRFGHDLKKLKSKFDEILLNELKYEETQYKGIKENKTFSSWRRSVEISLMAQFIVSAVADTDIDNVTTNAFYAESLSMKKKKIEECKNAERRVDLEVMHLLNTTLERIFKMLIAFYKGIIAYAAEREKVYKEVVDIHRRQSEEFLSNLQSRCEKAFFKAEEETLSYNDWDNKNFGNSSLSILIRMFRELCSDMGVKRGNFMVQYGDNGKLLHSVIGRGEICDMRQLDKIIEPNKGDLENCANAPKNLLEFFNKYLKHDNMTADITESVLNKYYECGMEILKFLTYNRDYVSEGKTNSQVVYDPVFPYVVRYREKSENRDKCSVCQYVINVDGEFDKTTGVKLLTEFDYKINELYYCIPNAESSTSNWWVAPFLISCREFDRIFLKLNSGEVTD